MKDFVSKLILPLDRRSSRSHNVGLRISCQKVGQGLEVRRRALTELLRSLDRPMAHEEDDSHRHRRDPVSRHSTATGMPIERNLFGDDV